MGAAIGGRHTVMVAITIPTPRRTVALTTGGMVIIIQRLTMTLPREPMAGNRLLMVPTDRQRAAPATILILGLTLAVPVSRHLMGAEAQRKRTIRTRELMLKPGKDRTRTLSGVAPTSREETRVPPWATTRPPMEQWQAPRIRREEKWPLLARSGGTVRLVKLPAVICTPGTMVMCIRIRVMAGRSTIMEAGTQ
jgi:hypothetical protein